MAKTFRKRERADGSKYSYPVRVTGGDEIPRLPLEVYKIDPNKYMEIPEDEFDKSSSKKSCNWCVINDPKAYLIYMIYEIDKSNGDVEYKEEAIPVIATSYTNAVELAFDRRKLDENPYMLFAIDPDIGDIIQMARSAAGKFSTTAVEGAKEFGGMVKHAYSIATEDPKEKILRETLSDYKHLLDQKLITRRQYKEAAEEIRNKFYEIRAKELETAEPRYEKAARLTADVGRKIWDVGSRTFAHVLENANVQELIHSAYSSDPQERTYAIIELKQKYPEVYSVMDISMSGASGRTSGRMGAGAVAEYAKYVPSGYIAQGVPQRQSGVWYQFYYDPSTRAVGKIALPIVSGERPRGM